MRSRIIDQSRAESVDRFDFPAVDSSAADALRGASAGSAHMLTAGQIDLLQKQATEEARRRGYEDGLAAGKAELAVRLARLTALTNALVHPFQALEQDVEDELVSLAVSLACHLVRRAVAHDPAALHAAVHDCLGVLAGSVRDVTLYLNPDDAALLQGQLPMPPDRRLTIATDRELDRGDLRVVGASSVVDGRLAARCAEIIAAQRAEGEGR